MRERMCYNSISYIVSPCRRHPLVAVHAAVGCILEIKAENSVCMFIGLN